MTQSNTALRAGTLLIIFRGLRTLNSFMDFSFAPVGVPLNKEHYQKKDFLTFFSLKVFLKHVSFEDRILFFFANYPLL